MSFDDAADDGEAEAGPFFLVVLNSELKARRHISSLMPAPVSLNSTATWVGASAPRGDAAPAW